MALENYADLQACVARWLHRSNMTADIVDCITLAEARIKAVLQAQLQDTTGTLSTVNGQNYVTLPSDLLRAHSLSIANTAPSIDYVTPDQLGATYYEGDVGIPQKYTLIGDRVYFGPTPDRVYTVSCVFQAAVPSLSDAAPTNSLLTKWPNVYLWAVMVEASKFAKDQAAQASYNADFMEAMSNVNIIEWHRGGPLAQRPDTRSW